MIMIDKEIYFKVYKDLIKDINKNGDILPVLLLKYQIPKEYDFTEKEVDDILKNTPKNIQDKINENFYNRRLSEKQLFYDNLDKSINEQEQLYQDYCEKELKSFLNKYPKYKNIIMIS